MQLTFRRPRANRTQGDQVVQELRRDGVEHFTRNRHAHVGQVAEQLPRHSQPFIDFEGLIDFRIVDQALPSDRRSGFLEIGTHYDAEIIGEFVREVEQSVCIFQSRFGVMDRARSHHDQESVILLRNDSDGITATSGNGQDGLIRLEVE